VICEVADTHGCVANAVIRQVIRMEPSYILNGCKRRTKKWQNKH